MMKNIASTLSASLQQVLDFSEPTSQPSISTSRNLATSHSETQAADIPDDTTIASLACSRNELHPTPFFTIAADHLTATGQPDSKAKPVARARRRRQTTIGNTG